MCVVMIGGNEGDEASAGCVEVGGGDTAAAMFV
jgi:hypothetical protein